MCEGRGDDAAGLRFRLGDEETMMALNGYMLRDIYPRWHFGLRRTAAFLITAISLNGVRDPEREDDDNPRIQTTTLIQRAHFLRGHLTGSPP